MGLNCFIEWFGWGILSFFFREWALVMFCFAFIFIRSSLIAFLHKSHISVILSTINYLVMHGCFCHGCSALSLCVEKSQEVWKLRLSNLLSIFICIFSRMWLLLGSLDVFSNLLFLQIIHTHRCMNFWISVVSHTTFWTQIVVRGCGFS